MKLAGGRFSLSTGLWAAISSSGTIILFPLFVMMNIAWLLKKDAVSAKPNSPQRSDSQLTGD